ncbi:MAG TPA: response regulator [Methylomirabilota bacterium]|jgi:CheY-like chemotaxis protein|nr:response regulator [Methylomirabilota bacterium]
MATRRVLVVDDEATVRSALIDILRAMRYPDALEVEGLADGQAALDSVVRQRPDLILLDLQMPRMSGLTLLKHIREIESRVPIIVISATEDTNVAAEALRHGAVAYIPKPFDVRHVEMLVTTYFDSMKRREAKPSAPPH